MKEENTNLKTFKQPRVKNLLLKVLGGVVILIFLCLVFIFWRNDCPWGTYGIIQGYLFMIAFTVLLLQTVITLMRRRRAEVFDRIFLLINISLIVFLYFSSFRNCIWD